jgi:hypothetical protein
LNLTRSIKDDYIDYSDDISELADAAESISLGETIYSDMYDSTKIFIPEVHCASSLYIPSYFARSEIKNNKGKKAQHIIQCAQEAEKVLLLSATPIFDKPSELGLTMNLLKPEVKFPVGSKFNQTFIKTKKTSNKISYDLKNVNKLKNLLNGYISYYKGAPDHVFPTKNLKYVKCIMSRYQYEAYKTTMEQEGKGRFLDSDILDLPNNFLIGPRIISNVAFPNKGINEEGYDSFKGKALDYEMLKIYSIKFYKIMVSR